MTADEMIARGELQAILPDPAGARAALEEARRHVESAASIAPRDPNGAYQLAYDGARKAVMAHMRERGVRVRRGEGGHAVTARYVMQEIDAELGARLDGMRRRRNRSEYGSTFFGPAEIEDAIAIASRLLEFVHPV
jgi:hypothetical protein